MRIKNMIDNDSPYCPVCGSCGIDGCCPPYMCKHTKGCEYPETPNGLLVRLARRFVFFRKTYDFWMDLPLKLIGIFVCTFIGHKVDKEFAYTCLRCYCKIKDE